MEQHRLWIRGIATIAAVAAIGSTSCSAWESRNNYTLRTDLQRNVGDPMLYSEKVSVSRRTGEKNPGRGNRQELIYTGRSGSTISISYREYANDFARPAFFQDLKYDLSESDTVVFRGFRLKVIEANNEYILFQVIESGAGFMQPQ